MNGFVQVLASMDLVKHWTAETDAACRAVATEGATHAGGRLIAGDPEFIFSADDSPDVVRVQYRMVK